jgi:predicted nucleotidyltransferase
MMRMFNYSEDRITMRLNDFEQFAIVSTVKSFDSEAAVYLFGSRVDDKKKGGDIDILILSGILTRDDKRNIKTKLYELLGEQKIDIVLAVDDSDPFVKLALGTGVKL